MDVIRTALESPSLHPPYSAPAVGIPLTGIYEGGGLMREFLDDFLVLHVNRLTVAKEIHGLIARYFPPLLSYTLHEITPLILERWVSEIGLHSKAQANKCLSLLHTMFEKAKDWRRFTGDNPASRVKKFARRARTRFVTPQEMPALMAALRREEEAVQCFFLLCLLCGCRRGEALQMQWTHIDCAAGLWHKPNTKTGRPHMVPIPRTLADRLCALPRLNAFVFAGKHGAWSPTFTFYKWHAIRTGAGLPDVTIHDLRRTCASWLAIHGENMAVIGKGVLNHTSISSTNVYAHLNVSPVTHALEANSKRMLN